MRPKGWNTLARRAVAAAAVAIVATTLASCGQATADTRTEVTVWSWEPSMAQVISRFEQANPDIRVTWQNMSGYDNINTAIQDGYGMPDVMQIEYYALPQYAVSGQFLDLTDRVSGRGYEGFFSPGTWSSVHLAGRVYGLPMDSGPMAFFYNKDVFDQAGVDAAAIRTWDDYYQAAKKLKDIGVYIAADAGDASFYDAMVWAAGGHPFRTSADGKDVTVDLTDDPGVRRFTAFWQRMIGEGLVDTAHTTWSDGWKRALGSGQVASVLSGAWMPSLLLADVPGTSGLWRVAQMPTFDGSPATAENGGSAMAVLQSTRKPDAAFRFVDFVTHDDAGIAARVDGGAFPADVGTMESREFRDKTTVKDARGVDVTYFGGQRFNQVLAQAAENVTVGYQYLPFEVYARSDFRKTVGTAYEWSKARQAYDERRRAIRLGMTDQDGNPLEPLDKPGKKVSLADGLALWQKDLEEYGTNQGFTVH
ncbi:sugar ABC transporter substrate-binding protein [Bifidobacterium pullorum subsp. saeculare]|uniref:Sugar ABC transporter substrate-binding protein n=1 Tax=Bifidobacterium pullorum subsp. saeculare TaxID=78257 RepID=A0A938WU38_9BIFI|nr:sugar ABC transporter substrate-binding protein [Bifidobacterium pullorum]MBM6698770.1 sugar ABC transporter substrate-binding protein [Bifidobacterium pullorum subsp. saeculare]